MKAGHSTHEFTRKSACFAIQAGFKKSANGSWQPDANELILYCAGLEVGKCSFNLSAYIGKNPVVEKARIVPADSPNSSRAVLKGNAE